MGYEVRVLCLDGKRWGVWVGLSTHKSPDQVRVVCYLDRKRWGGSWVDVKKG